MYKIPPAKKNFRLLEDLTNELVTGCVFHINEIQVNPRKKIKDRVYLTFPVKDNKDTPIKYNGLPSVIYEYLTVAEFNELQFEEV